MDKGTQNLFCSGAQAIPLPRQADSQILLLGNLLPRVEATQRPSHHTRYGEAVIKSSRRSERKGAQDLSCILHSVDLLRYREAVIKSSRGLERNSGTKWRSERIPPDRHPSIPTLKGSQKT
jgi:hypothetical protein